MEKFPLCEQRIKTVFLEIPKLCGNFIAHTSHTTQQTSKEPRARPLRFSAPSGDELKASTPQHRYCSESTWKMPGQTADTASLANRTPFKPRWALNCTSGRWEQLPSCPCGVPKESCPVWPNRTCCKDSDSQQLLCGFAVTLTPRA